MMDNSLFEEHIELFFFLFLSIRFIDQIINEHESRYVL